MKQILFLCTIASLMFGTIIHWEKDFDAALKASKKSHKPILMLVDRPNCPYCQLLKEDIRESKAVSAFINKKFIPVLVRQNDGSYPAERFSVYGTPTTFFVNAKGESYSDPIVGYVEKEKYLRYLSIGFNYFFKIN